MAAVLSGAGRRLTATRELDLTKYYFYQYPQSSTGTASKHMTRGTSNSHVNSHTNLTGQFDDGHQLSPVLSSSPAPSSSSPNQSSSQSTPDSFSTSPRHKRHTTNHAISRRHARDKRQEQPTVACSKSYLKFQELNNSNEQQELSTMESAISALVPNCNNLLKSTTTAQHARQRQLQTATDCRTNSGATAVNSRPKCDRTSSSQQRQQSIILNPGPIGRQHCKSPPANVNSCDDLSLGSCPSTTESSGQQLQQHFSTQTNDEKVRMGDQVASLRRQAPPLPPAALCRLETRSKPDNCHAAVRLAEEIKLQKQQQQQQSHRMISSGFAVNKETNESPIGVSSDNCCSRRVELGREVKSQDRQHCYHSQQNPANTCRTHLATVMATSAATGAPTQADQHHFIIDLDANLQRRQKPTIEEQLRRLLDLEPLDSTTTTNRHCPSPLRGDYHHHCPLAMARNDCGPPPPPPHQLGAASSISNKLQNQLKLVKKPHIYHQASRMNDRQLQLQEQQIAGSQAPLTPADEMMLFMLASRRAAASGANSVAGKNARILKWLDDCAKSMCDTTN